MKITLNDAKQLGPLVRAVRKAQHLRQDDTAELVGVGENFLGKIERGGETVQWGKLFQVLAGLGIRLSAELPVVTREEQEALEEVMRRQGVDWR